MSTFEGSPDQLPAAGAVEGRVTTGSLAADIAPLSPAEYDPLAEYLAGSEGDAMRAADWRQRMELWWEKNPAFTPHQKRGWRIKVAGKIVGFFGVLPIRFQLAGREILTYAATTWRAEAAHRHHTLAAIAPLLHYTGDSLLFTWTQTPVLIKVLKALKFVPLPREEAFYRRQACLLPIGLSGLTKFWPGHERMASLALAGPNALVRFYARLARARLGPSGRGLEVRELRHADDEFDRLWARTDRVSPATNVRTAAVVNWQCFAVAVRRKRLVACYRRNELAGFAVVGVQPIKDARLLLFECLDLWVDPALPGVTDALVGGVVELALDARADLLEVPSYSPAIGAVSRRAGFLPRRQPDRGEFVRGPAPKLASLAAPGAYFSALQGDRGL